MRLDDYFKHEAHDFTPWLAKNPIILQDILGMPVSIYKRECKVQSFYIDLVLKGKDQCIIVENQFGLSDHDHLGKIITYAALTHADTAIWIAESFRFEHLKIFETLCINLILCSMEIDKSEKGDYYLKLTCYSSDKTRVLLYRLDAGTPIRLFS